MVFLTNFLGYGVRKMQRKYLRSGFMDSLRIYVKGGAGGMGLPRYGGIGGKGGDVYVVAQKGVQLQAVTDAAKKKKFHGGPGENSSSSGLIGQNGTDFIIPAPPGVTIYSEDGALLGEVNVVDEKLKVAAGGIGGCPETGFSGQKGQARRVVLDLRLIADVGLVGFPNAGKSTLLRAVSYAKPKVASYPFTTVRPHLGIIHYPDLRKVSVADLPGLIEGAHMNIGRGHKFLKHLSRTQLLAFVIDIQGFQLSQMRVKRSCLETIVLLNKEVELYKPDLLRKPAILIVNKMDTNNAQDIYRDIEPSLNDLETAIKDFPEEMRPETALKFEEIITTSLLEKKGEEVEKLKTVIRGVLDKTYEANNDSPSNFDESEFVNEIKRDMREIAPTLV